MRHAASEGALNRRPPAMTTATRGEDGRSAVAVGLASNGHRCRQIGAGISAGADNPPVARLPLVQPAVLEHLQRLRELLAADFERDDVGAGLDGSRAAAASAPSTAAAERGLTGGRLRGEVPHDPVDAGGLRTVE